MTKPALTHRITLVIASANRGKLREIEAILQEAPVHFVPLDRFGHIEMPPESGDSFQENARRKALFVAERVQHYALADDSGLEVEALGGQPGVRSARYGGPGLTDADRNQLLLQALDGVPLEQRTARFRCAVALASPAGDVRVVEATCEGRIGLAPRGAGGFGYDPVFEVPALGATLAELPPAAKDRFSHRAQALARIRPALEALARQVGSSGRGAAR